MRNAGSAGGTADVDSGDAGGFSRDTPLGSGVPIIFIIIIIYADAQRKLVGARCERQSRASVCAPAR